MNKEANVLLLISGGIDSTALINYYLGKNYSVKGLFIDYGQLASKYERRAVNKIIGFYNIEVDFLDIGSGNHFKSGEIIGRNLLLLSTAFTYFSDGFGIIALGIHSGTNYIDCSKEFVKAVQVSFDMYKNGQVQIDAPFINLSKVEIWKYCLDNNIPIDLTYSCENGKTAGCGICLSCKDKESLYEFSKKH